MNMFLEVANANKTESDSMIKFRIKSKKHFNICN